MIYKISIVVVKRFFIEYIREHGDVWWGEGVVSIYSYSPIPIQIADFNEFQIICYLFVAYIYIVQPKNLIF